MVLAGAALEIGLRSVVDAHGLNPDGKQLTISTLAQVLRSNELISRQEVKDIEQVGGLRNSAAHGIFDGLSRERAGLMEQQVNILMARIENILDKGN